VAAPLVAVLVGSPRRGGTSEALAARVARGAETAGARVRTVVLADYELAGCTGCGACEATGVCVLADGPGRPGFDALLAQLAPCDGLALVAPVFFAGPPSQLKAVLDRLQPLWAQRYLLGRRPVLPLDERRPGLLVAVGAGGDPFGFEPLVTCCRSALRMLDVEIAEVCDCVGASASQPPAPCYLERAEAAGRALAERLTRP
jgi:hypothetical protein